MDKDDIEINELEDLELLEEPEILEQDIPVLIKKSTPKKEKEKKVMDFKFRIVDLLEIFVNKSKNPENFLVCLIPIIDCIKENLKDSKKQSFIEKIGNLIKRFFEKKLAFKEEALINLQDCLSHIIFVNAKINSKKTSKIFENIINIMTKLIFSIRNDQTTQSFISKEYEKALTTYSTKKDIFYSNEFFKQFIKNEYSLSLCLIEPLIKYSGLADSGGLKDDFKRNFVLNLLSYLINFKTVNFINEKKTKIQDNLPELTKLIINFFENNENIKKHRVSFLNKIGNLALTLYKFLLENQEKEEAHKFALKLKKQLNAFEIADKNLNKIKKNLIDHLKN